MIPAAFEYLVPTALPEAIALLQVSPQVRAAARCHATQNSRITPNMTNSRRERTVCHASYRHR